MAYFNKLTDPQLLKLLAVVGVLSILLQIIGLSTKGWARGGNGYVNAYGGLWSIDVCNVFTGCASLSLDDGVKFIPLKFRDYAKSEIYKLRSFTMIALLTAMFGMAFAAFLFINPTKWSFRGGSFSNNKTRQFGCFLTWLISTVFLLVAVVCGSQINEAAAVANPNMGFPWSILISGFGMVASAAFTGILLMRMIAPVEVEVESETA